MSVCTNKIYNQLKFAFGLSVEEGDTNSINVADGHLFNNGRAEIPVRLGFRIEADSDDPLSVTIKKYGLVNSQLMTDLSLASAPFLDENTEVIDVELQPERLFQAYPHQIATLKDFSSWSVEPLNLEHQWRFWVTNAMEMEVDEAKPLTLMGWVLIEVHNTDATNKMESTEFILYSNMEANWDVLGTTMVFKSSIAHQIDVHGKPSIEIIKQKAQYSNVDSAFDTIEVWEFVGYYESNIYNYVDGKDAENSHFNYLGNGDVGKPVNYLEPNTFWEASFWGNRGGVNEITRAIFHQHVTSEGTADIGTGSDADKVKGTITLKLHDDSVSYDYSASGLNANYNTSTALTYSWFRMKDSRIENDLAARDEFSYSSYVYIKDVYGGVTTGTLTIEVDRDGLSTNTLSDIVTSP